MIDGVRDPLLPLVEEAITIPTRSTGPRATVPRSCCHCRRRCSHSRSHHRCHSRCSHCRCCRIVVAVVASSWLSTHRTIVVRHPPDLHHSYRGVASSNTASPICIIATIHETTRVEPNENEDKVGRRGLTASMRYQSTMCGHGSPSIALSWLFSTCCQSTVLCTTAPPRLLGTGEKQWSPWCCCP
jgi:hypothetical protein